VLEKELPEVVKKSVQAYIGCVAGASLESEYLGAIEAAGFGDVRVMDTSRLDASYMADDPAVATIAEEIGIEQAKELAGSILSVKVSAVKPK
jgi:arsenite methyltransferase